MANPGLSDGILQQAVDAVAAHGAVASAARFLGLAEATFRNRYSAALRRNFVPQVQRLVGNNAAPPEGYRLKGTSTYFDSEGAVRAQWVKTTQDQQAIEAAQKAAFDALCAELKPLPKVAAPKVADKDLATLYTLTDCHIGMRAWAKETGENWDLEIAEDCIVKTAAQMIQGSRPSAVGILNQLGDFLHWDSMQPLTPTSSHVLDADSRYQKVVEVAVRILRRVIDIMLEKHERVHIKMLEGNHDPAGSVWLRVMFDILYSKNPRVTVDKSPNPYTIFQHGKTLLGFHHGHLSKMDKLPAIFAAQFRQEWGSSTHMYIHTGHLHHVHENEYPGANVIQHPTLAAKDAYAARFGFLSKRQLTAMTYDKDRGEIGRASWVPA